MNIPVQDAEPIIDKAEVQGDAVGRTVSANLATGPTTDDLRSFAQRAGYDVGELIFTRDDRPLGFYVHYTGSDPALRALRDTGPFDNEADAWARAYTLAREAA